MYRDLDSATWPPESKPGAHAIMHAPLQNDGFQQPSFALADDAHVDRHLMPAAANHVVDADSAQVLAIIEAGLGHNMVIQGPPGTGKSQTITNLIADALVRGKTVLFVSEKMAALEVVKRRLDAIGLGDPCLELHSNKTHKRTVLAALKRTLEQARSKPAADDEHLRQVTEIRDLLNDYC